MLKSLKALSKKFSGGLTARHPDFVELVAHRDGELSTSRAASIAEHLEVCSECRAETGRIELGMEAGARAFGETASAPPAGEGLERLFRVIRDDRLLAAEQERLSRARDHRLATELKTYFGSYPESLLRRSPDEGPAFREEISRLVQCFLGRTAALALIERIDFEMSKA
jgi:hypothetical protein